MFNHASWTLTMTWVGLGVAWLVLLALPGGLLGDPVEDIATGVLAAATGGMMARTSGHRDKRLLLAALVANRPRDARPLTVLRGPRHVRRG